MCFPRYFSRAKGVQTRVCVQTIIFLGGVSDGLVSRLLLFIVHSMRRHLRICPRGTTANRCIPWAVPLSPDDRFPFWTHPRTTARLVGSAGTFLQESLLVRVNLGEIAFGFSIVPNSGSSYHARVEPASPTQYHSKINGRSETMSAGSSCSGNKCMERTAKTRIWNES